LINKSRIPIPFLGSSTTGGRTWCQGKQCHTGSLRSENSIAIAM